MHDMKPQTEEIDVGALIIAAGYQPFDAREKPEFGYGRYPNVITSMEFERILSASGPFDGKISRPSDLKKPKRIAWIQCVGSRDQLCGKEYCSSVCCMYATKEAIITREHSSDIETTIFYNDIRAFGKGFDRYYERAKNELGVRYIKSIVSSVKQFSKSKNLTVTYIDDLNGLQEQEVDMVVLSVGLVPSESAVELFDRLGIATDRYHFCQPSHSGSPVGQSGNHSVSASASLPVNFSANPAVSFSAERTNRQGVFVCGAAESPKDIPESIMQASCTAALAAEILADVRGELVSRKQYPAEREVENEEPRIGVFVCHCGTNIARVIDVESLTQFALRLSGVVHAERNLYTCSSDSQRRLIETIREKGINRVVVSSCTPRTHEALFQDAVREAGLNRYLFEMANIRDQCAWVHPDTPELALDKSKDLLAMAVERAATLEPLEEKEYRVIRSGLVLGGGVAGMTAALSLANQGFVSTLVEKSSELGGNLRKVLRLLDGSNTSLFLKSLIETVEEHPDIDILRDAEVVDFSGHVGEFETTIRQESGEKEIEHGIVIFATGAQEYQPHEYLYGESERVLTQLELEELITSKPQAIDRLHKLVMIQCVGSREEPNNYCSRVCCQEAVKNALHVLERNPEAKVFVLYRDMRTYGLDELYYLKAREKGVTFIRYDLESKPVVEQAEGSLSVKVLDTTLGRNVELETDILVLSTGIRADQTTLDLLQKYKAGCNEDGFLLEAHMKLRPLDFANEGMFMAGLAHGPKLLRESLTQAFGAASRAATILSKDAMRVAATVAVIDEERCAACLTCLRVCPFDVPRLNDDNRAYIDPASCQGCGICAAVCPAKAIEVQHYKDNQVLAKCDALEVLKQLDRL